MKKMLLALTFVALCGAPIFAEDKPVTTDVETELVCPSTETDECNHSDTCDCEKCKSKKTVE